MGEIINEGEKIFKFSTIIFEGLWIDYMLQFCVAFCSPVNNLEYHVS